MSLDQGTVSRIAHLARLRISDEEKGQLVGELNRILQWVEQLDAVDVADVAPLTSVVDLQLRLREDAVTDGGQTAAVLANAHDAKAGFFVVPKVVE